MKIHYGQSQFFVLNKCRIIIQLNPLETIEERRIPRGQEANAGIKLNMDITKTMEIYSPKGTSKAVPERVHLTVFHFKCD